MLFVDLEAEKVTPLLLGADKGRSGTGERVEHHAMLRAASVGLVLARAMMTPTAAASALQTAKARAKPDMRAKMKVAHANRQFA